MGVRGEEKEVGRKNPAQKCLGKAGRVMQWVKILIAKLGNLSSISETQMVEGENQLLCLAL